MRRIPECYQSDCGTYAWSFDSRGNIIKVDLEDAHLLQSYIWSCTGKGYVYRMVNRQAIYLHKVIMNAPGKQQVDHNDKDKGNNRRYNLRLATNSQNQANQGRNSNSRYYRGVYRSGSKYFAQIKHGGKSKWLGSFNCPIEAAIAWDIAAYRLHGEFAVLNFPKQN